MFGRFQFIGPTPRWVAPTPGWWRGGCACGCPGFWLTHEEALASLEEYKQALEDEIKQVQKRIEEMKKDGGD